MQAHPNSAPDRDAREAAQAALRQAVRLAKEGGM
jgi:hypothetical protein